MAVFKCKMCGGTLEINNNESVATCEYCGTQQTLPRLDDEKRANLYDRANHFRRNNEFDKAMAIYEKILEEDSKDAEAYWSLVLCRYGIEYVEDPTTHKRIPTVNRAQFSSVVSDKDYKSALKYGDASQKEIYKSEARAIDKIQKEILSISQKEEPFDVFICYKETDAHGRRTPDSVLANDLYHQLTQEGFKVFFARITLEDKLGTSYEPYIFAALNSAKVMVVIGTNPEYFNAVWVKNEWSRYLSLVRQSDGKKMLIPAYKDMDPYDLPEEFSHLQAQDMSKLGFMQDLIRGINKCISKKTNFDKKDAMLSQDHFDTRALIKRCNLYLEDKEWDNAKKCAEKILNSEPENPNAYLIKLLADLNITNQSNLIKSNIIFDKNSNYRKAIRFADEEQKRVLINIAKSVREKNQDRVYESAIKMMQANNIESIKSALKKFKLIYGYKDSAQMVTDCENKIESLVNKAKQKKKHIKIIKILTLILSLVAVFSVIFAAIILPYLEYNQAVKNLEAENFELAYNYFNENDYKDSQELKLETQYRMAINDLEHGRYTKAYDYFKNSSYKDSQDLKLKAQYEYVLYHYDRFDDQTYMFLKELKEKDYKDSAEKFDALYAWNITLDYCNTSANDFETNIGYMPKKCSYFQMGFYLTGGEPGKSVTMYNKTKWPDGSILTSSWYWEDFSAGEYPSIEWRDGLSNHAGAFTIEFYEVETDKCIGRVTLPIK